MELGAVREGGRRKSFKIKDGDNVYRILPPMGKLAKKGMWNQYYRVAWGYKTSDGKLKPFQDPRQVNYNTKMVEVESAAHMFLEGLKAKKESVVEALKKDPQNQSLREQAKKLVEDIKAYNIESKYYVNVVNLQGEIGLLKIGKNALDLLKTEIENAKKDNAGQHPVGSLERGLFFNIRRTNSTGNFQDTKYQVTVYQENVDLGNGRIVKENKTHTMDAAFIARLEDEAFDLSDLYPRPTAAQVERMVKEGPTAVDEILGSNAQAVDDDGDDESTASSTQTQSSTQASAPQTQAAPPVQQAPATQAAPVQQQAATVTTPPPGPAATGDLSQDAFLKSIGAIP